MAVITGAGSGMGRAITLLFAQEGAKIIAAEWNQTTLDEVVAEVKDAGGQIVGVKSNVAVRAEAEAMVDAAIEHFGRIDILCNNAGVMDQFQGVGELSDEIWRRVLSINLDGPMFASRRAIPHMVAHGSGSIILQPTDIANLALFLASDESRQINGTIIPADAGWLAT